MQQISRAPTMAAVFYPHLWLARAVGRGLREAQEASSLEKLSF